MDEDHELSDFVTIRSLDLFTAKLLCVVLDKQRAPGWATVFF